MPILIHDNPPIQPSGPVRLLLIVITEQQAHLDTDLLHPSQPRHNALLVQHRVRRAYAALEVAFQVPDWQGGGHEIEGRGRGKAGAVLGQQIKRGRPVWRVRGRWREVEGEEGVVD